ncbi:MAG: hypothetical protein L0H94_08670 [Nitrospira sp.]|nr:hypothetical protein [Nitrospira sp.]
MGENNDIVATREGANTKALYCETQDFMSKSIPAQMKQDSRKVMEYGKRINDIQKQLPDYEAAFAFLRKQPMEFYKTAKGKALDQASKKLDTSCPKP